MSTPRTRRSRFSRTGNGSAGEGKRGPYSVLKLSGSLVFTSETSPQEPEKFVGYDSNRDRLHCHDWNRNPQGCGLPRCPEGGSPSSACVRLLRPGCRWSNASARRNALLTHCGRFRPRIGCSLKPRACPRRAAREGKPPRQRRRNRSGTKSSVCNRAISGPACGGLPLRDRGYRFRSNPHASNEWRYAGFGQGFCSLVANCISS